MLEIMILILLILETIYVLFSRLKKNSCKTLNLIQKGGCLSRKHHSPINTTREKKEVKKKAVEAWKEEHGESRKHFNEKKRKTRKDKGKRREESVFESRGMHPRLGKPKGSPGGAWRRPPEEEVDKVVHVHLKKCPKCGKKSLGKSFGTWEHYVLDLVPNKRGMQLIIINYILHRYRCKNCKKTVNVSLGILKHCHFGFGFIAMVMQSRIARKESYSKILEELDQWIPEWSQFISRTTIVDWFKKYGNNLEDFYLECVKKLKRSKFVHADETGLPMKGKNWWLWIITTTFFTLFVPSNTRGRKAIETFFDDFKGVLISDFWGAYNKLTAEQQKCLGHLVKDLKVIVMKSEKIINTIEKRLEEDGAQKKILTRERACKKTPGRPKASPELLSEEDRDVLEEKKKREAKNMEYAIRFYHFFKQAWADDDNPLSYKARPELRATEEDARQQLREVVEKIQANGDLDPDIERIINRIERFENYLFTYLTHPGIPPDNNAAERELRPFVIMRRTSHDFKNEDVMDSFTFYLSFYQTCKKNKVNFNKALKSVLSGDVSSVLKAIRVH
jgi:transposase